MISFCGYNLCYDINAMDVFPTNLTNITNTELTNAIFDHIDISKSTNIPYSVEIPIWDYETILDCNFEDNIAGGNMDITLSQITSLKIKRRVEGSFDWTTLKEYTIDESEDFIINTFDRYNTNGLTYEYAVVPILNGIEGNYITSSVDSCFNSIFIVDRDGYLKLDKNVVYEARTSNQLVGEHVPIGRKYPIVVTNANADYSSGGLSGTILNDDYDETRSVDRLGIVDQTKIAEVFLKNKKPKIIKDWNGNTWLVMIVGNPTINYSRDGGGVVNISFQYTEQGDANNTQDLYNNGLIGVIE